MEKLSIFQQCNPTSRQHTCREKNREEQDGGHLTCRNKRRRSRSREEEETAALGRGGGHREQLPVDADSRRSGRRPAAHAPQLPPRRQSCAAASFCQPAPAPAGCVRHLASPSSPHPRSHWPPRGRESSISSAKSMLTQKK
jgi:hypothetical protein